MTMPSSLRILALESFDGGAHAAVRHAIERWGRSAWTWVTRPDRAWKWRMRVSSAELLQEAGAAGLLDDAWDAIFVTSLTPVADLRAFLPPHLRTVPIILYMHENQVAYPNRHATVEEAKRDHHFAITNLTSMLASDCVIFNSAWNRDSFLTGIGAVLSHQPDQITHEWIESIGAKSVIAWPPVDLEPVDREATVLHNTPTVVWPCRWEHDKGPERLLEIARQYSDAWDLRWIILGGQSSSIPPEMALFLDEQGDRILHAGFVEDRAAYLQWLSRGDWVLSTAHHEFFGLAVAEALLMGCLPWLPDTLSYPELLPESAKGLSPGEPPDDPKAIRRACVDHLRPAMAVNAVSKIEQIIAAVIQKGPPSPFWEPCHHGTAGS